MFCTIDQDRSKVAGLMSFPSAVAASNRVGSGRVELRQREPSWSRDDKTITSLTKQDTPRLENRNKEHKLVDRAKKKRIPGSRQMQLYKPRQKGGELCSGLSLGL